MALFSVKFTLIMLTLITIGSVGLLILFFSEISSSKRKEGLSLGLFPLRGTRLSFMVRGFVLLAGFNLISIVCYSYPVTTTLGFNLSLALILWISSILFMVNKLHLVRAILPSNSPWYLASFLCLVELIRIGVRPITLCFRLLANLRAGHVLLTLICKIPLGLWSLGTLFGVLELIVSFVQAFVFLILTTVYLEEAVSH